MRVYRIEHKDSRCGPWYHEGFRARPLDANEMPTPWMIGLEKPKEPSRWSFIALHGFRRLRTLRHWFTSRDAKYLDAHGFVLRVFDVPAKYVHTSKPHKPVYTTLELDQVIFAPGKAKLVRTIDLGKYYYHHRHVEDTHDLSEYEEDTNGTSSTSQSIEP